MDRINRILKNESYREYLYKNSQEESGRIFCCHNIGHFLDVARIAMILNQQDGYGQEREMIYAAALLHDIGRWKQYQEGTPHEVASAGLSPAILSQCGFGEGEREAVLVAVGNHRNPSVKEEKSLSGLLYRADKLSRPCFACEAEKECGWVAEKKNLELAI
ncbi:hypothetical protein IMSAGC019_00920 [Lachnospiraceae bacterium]|nr:hypothetical protein IMSAGC019_00920 [Lachnospiraceae bacterium]